MSYKQIGSMLSVLGLIAVFAAIWVRSIAQEAFVQAANAQPSPDVIGMENAEYQMSMTWVFLTVSVLLGGLGFFVRKQAKGDRL